MVPAFLKACVWDSPVPVRSLHTECITAARGPSEGLASVAVEFNIFPSKKDCGLSLGPNSSHVPLQRGRRNMIFAFLHLAWDPQAAEGQFQLTCLLQGQQEQTRSLEEIRQVFLWRFCKHNHFRQV